MPALLRAAIIFFKTSNPQLFVPGHTFQLIDLQIDLIGVLFGVFLYTRLKINHEDTKHTKKKIRNLI